MLDLTQQASDGRGVNGRAHTPAGIRIAPGLHCSGGYRSCAIRIWCRRCLIWTP